VALQGQVVETGAFVITLDYNELKSYFKSKTTKINREP
jgi:hypothetical protein